MRTRKLSIFAFILCSSFISAELLADDLELYAPIKPNKNFSLSAEVEGDVDQYNGSSYSKLAFCFSIGALNNLDINLKYRLYNTVSPYYGGSLEYHFIRGRLINFAISTGGHYRGGAVYDLTPVFGHSFEDFSFVTGPEFNWPINSWQMELDWFFGISAPLGDSFEVSVNVGFPIKNDTYWISNGLTWLF
jgi:hypothetical protein